MELEKISVQVPQGSGHVIGNTLRSFATRSVGSYQSIGYKTDTKATGFGMSNGSQLSYLEFLRGELVYTGKGVDLTPETFLAEFSWNGAYYVFGDFELHGLSHGLGDTITACIAYGFGHKSAAQNHEEIKRANNGSADGFLAVPCSHQSVGAFRYSIKPCDDKREWLCIEATPGVASRACKSILDSFSALNL